MCILVGLFLASIPSARALRSFCTVWLILMSIACLALEQHNVRTRWASLVAWLSGHPADLPIAIAHDLRGSLQPDSFVYVYDYQPILYFLLNARMPIKYAFPPHHLYPDYGRDPLSEMTEILAKTPQIIIAGSDPATGQFGAASYLLNATLKQKYEILKSYPVRGTGAVFVYRRLTAAHAQHPDEIK